MLTNEIQEKALQLLVSTFREKARQKLSKSKRGIFSGKLLESISATLSENDGEYIFSVDMEEYGTFIDEGVNGVGFEQTKSGKADKRFKTNRKVVTGAPYSFKNKKPPLDAIRPWANAKGLNPYAVQNSIFRKGIKGIHFFQEVMDYEVDKMADYIAEAEAEQLLNDFGKD